MKILSSRPIIYFALGLLIGGSLAYLYEFNDKYRMEIGVQQLDHLLKLLLHLLLWGVLMGGLTLLVSRGLALIFLEEPNKPAPQVDKKT